MLFSRGPGKEKTKGALFVKRSESQKDIKKEQQSGKKSPLLLILCHLTDCFFISG